MLPNFNVRRGVGRVLFVSAVLSCSCAAQAAQETSVQGPLQPDDQIKTLTITIFVGDQGEDLDEPIALDLGLGLPLWLHPVGRQMGSEVPFGAVPQKATTQSVVRAGESATFTFDIAGEPGQDVLETTPQLLAGVRLADIKRVGFASTRKSDWVLQGYKLAVNGLVFAEDKSGVPRSDPTQTALAARVAQLDRRLLQYRKGYERLLSVDKQTVTGADRKRAEQIETEATAAYQQRNSLENQLQINPKSAKDTRARDLRRLRDIEARIEQLQWQPAAPVPQDAPQESAARDGAPQEIAAQDGVTQEPATQRRVGAEGVIQGSAPLDRGLQVSQATPISEPQDRPAEPPQPVTGEQAPSVVPADEPGPQDATWQQTDLQALQLQERLLKGRLRGGYPWFLDDQFQPLTRSGPSDQSSLVKRIEVTLETQMHVGADTQNYIYLATGGHKYQLNSRFESLSASVGPQRFQVDMLSGPLTVAEADNWALGMLAVPTRQGTVPKGWHAQRVIVKVDGTAVYDSDENPLDRKSLEAVRIIPPAQLDLSGKPVSNSASARMVFLWEAGKGQGLDLAQGGSLALADADDSHDLDAENGLATGDDSGQTGLDSSGDDGSGDDGSGDDGSGDDGSGDYGSGDYGSGDYGSGDYGGGGYGDGDYGGGNDAGGNYGGGNYGSGGSGSGGSGGGSGNSGSVLPPPVLEVGPTSLGPFQMQKVWISKGWKTNEPFTINWEVAGEMSGIDHFLVSLKVVRPDQPNKSFADVAPPAKVDVGQRSYVALVTKTTSQPYYYLAPCVTAVTKDPSKQKPQSHAKIGPARAVFPPSANDRVKPVPKDVTVAGGGGPVMISPSPPPAGGTSRAWFVTHPDSTDARRFGPANPGSHVAVRLKQGEKVTVRCEVSKPPGKSVPFSGKQKVVVHLGYMGATNGLYSADVEMACTLVGTSGAKKYAYPVWKGTVSTGTSLVFAEQLLDAADLGVPVEKAEIKFTFGNGGSADPKCMPGIFGLRMFPVSSGTGKPVNADLVIDQTSSYLVPGDIRLLPGEYLPAIYRPLQLAVKNNGPDDIPASVLRQVKVKVIYYLGQYGNTWGDIHTPAYRKEVTCGPYRVTELRELTSNGKWQGSLKKGETLKLIPSPPAGHPWLDQDGKLRSTKKSVLHEANAHKLFMVWANIQPPGAAVLKDNPSNNAWKPTYSPPIVIGKGPLDFEVVLCSAAGFSGTSARYEMNPDTQRQRLVWDLGHEPGQPDLYRKVRSFMLGRNIDLFACDDHHFFATGRWMPLFQGNKTGAYHAKLLGEMGSVILCNKRNRGPIGVALARGLTVQFPPNKILPPQSFFFPMHEQLNKKVKDFPSIAPVFDDEATHAAIWRTPQATDIAGKVGGKIVTAPAGWLKVTLYKDAGCGGNKKSTLDKLPNSAIDSSLGWTKWTVNLDGRPWDGEVIGNGWGAPDVAGDVSSLRMELKGSVP